MIMPILAVRDTQASIEFYTQTLGFQLVFSMPGQEGGVVFGIVSLSETASIGLMADAETTDRGKGVALMTYVTPDTDIDAYYADVQAKGVPIAREIRDEFWGDRCFDITDIDGYYLSICKTTQQMSNEEIITNAAGSMG